MNWKPLREVRYLIVHCSATPMDMDIGATEIRRWHRERGWFDIAYHAVIRRDGTEEPGRPLDRPGAHARGFNHLSLGVCLVGGTKADKKTAEQNFDPRQYAALRALLGRWKQLYPDAIVLGHRDLPNVYKACPSFDVRAWYDNVGEGET